VTDFTFTKYSCAVQFITSLDSICELEHVCSVPVSRLQSIHSLEASSSTLILRSDQSPILTLYVQTHYAFRPRWNQEDPSTSPSLSRRVPGMTFASPSSLNSSTTLFYIAEESLKQEAIYLDNLLINLPGIIFLLVS